MVSVVFAVVLLWAMSVIGWYYWSQIQVTDNSTTSKIQYYYSNNVVIIIIIFTKYNNFT